MPIMPIRKTTTATVPTEVQMWQFSSERADASAPGRLRCLFRPLDNDGNWDEAAEVLRFLCVDDLTQEDPNARAVASDIRSAMLAAIVPECEAVTRLEAVTGLTLAGLTFQAMGETLIPRLVQLGLLTRE